MPDFRFVSAKSTVQPTSGYASRISQTEWLQHEDVIRRLHQCGSTKDDILRTLVDDLGFQPSAGQLRDQLARWGLKSSRRNKIGTASGGEDISSGSMTVSDSRQDYHPSPQRSSLHVYGSVPDEAFASMWPQYDMGLLPYQTAIEMEVLADVLFLGGRYVAAFNLYSSIYYAVCCTSRSEKVDFTAARFRALIGCLRSSANSEQRLQVVTFAEQELKNSSARFCCRLGDVCIRQEQNQSNGSLMSQFYDRESFRHAIAATESASTVSDVVEKLHLDDGHTEALEWCFGRLNTPAFISVYNEHVRQAGSGVACWTYGGSQSIIYWYLIVDAMNSPEHNLPPLTIRHASGHKYTFLVFETFAIVAAMVSSEPWLFSLDQLPSESLRRWTSTILHDDAVFSTIFQHAIRTTMVPNFATRLNKTKSDTLATANTYPAYRMPVTSILETLAAQIRQAKLVQVQPRHVADDMELDSSLFNDLTHLEFESLTREYSEVIISYVNENCAYGTSYQFSEKPRERSRVKTPSASIKPKPVRTPSERPQLMNACDPTLVGGSTGSSFRSFQSTHARSKKITTQWPASEVISMVSDSSSNFGKQLPALVRRVGVR